MAPPGGTKNGGLKPSACVLLTFPHRRLRGPQRRKPTRRHPWQRMEKKHKCKVGQQPRRKSHVESCRMFSQGESVQKTAQDPAFKAMNQE